MAWAWLVLAELLAIPVLWLFYLAVMNLSGVKKSGGLNSPAKAIGYLIFVIGYLLDVIINVATVSFIFLDPPRQWTVSQRLQQYVDGRPGWRRNLALWFANNLMNPFSPGGPHIKRIADSPTSKG